MFFCRYVVNIKVIYLDIYLINSIDIALLLLCKAPIIPTTKAKEQLPDPIIRSNLNFIKSDEERTLLSRTYRDSEQRQFIRVINF